MKSSIMKSAMLSLCLFFGASIAGAATVTVGPSGMYPDPCTAFAHLADGDTVTIDANNGVPYFQSECNINNNNLTITGINGRPIMDGTGQSIDKGMWDVNGHDIVIDNIEFRNIAPGDSANAEAFRIQRGTTSAPDGGNVTIQRCYIHNDADSLISDETNYGSPSTWYSTNPYITMSYDEMYYDGDGNGYDHNTYPGYGGNMNFTLQYSWSHDSWEGIEVKSRAPINNLFYDLISDVSGIGGFLVSMPQGGSTYMVGNTFVRGATSCCNQAFIMWYTPDQDANTTYPDYAPPNQDLHFVNNTVINDPANNSDPDFVNINCYSFDDPCPTPPSGVGNFLTTPPVFENNIFLGALQLGNGEPQGITNSSIAIESNNIVLANTPANLAANFVDAAHYDYHLVSGSPAIGEGIYPPTDNTGAADPNALAKYEYVNPVGIVTRPTPSGSHMDAGAYSYPRVGTPPTLNLSYTESVTVPGTGTITVSGLPTPPAGQYNDVVFASGYLSLIPEIPSVATSTGTVTTTFSTLPAVIGTTTVVPIDIYADGAHATANVTVTPGPPTLNSVTFSSSAPAHLYYPQMQVNLNGPAPVGGLLINCSSSDPTYLYSPATVTVPEGQLTAEIGTLNGSLYTPDVSPAVTETCVVAAGGTPQSFTAPIYEVPSVNGMGCVSSCTVTGGQPIGITYMLEGTAPIGGAPITITSSNTAVVPAQTFNLAAGQPMPIDQPTPVTLTTNSVTASTSVTLYVIYNGVETTYGPSVVTITVTPGGVTPASIGVVSGSGQSAAIGTPFTNPLVAVVETSSGAPVSGATVTFAGANVSFPSGATAVTGSNGQAQVTAEPTAAGALTITASVAGVSTPASFAETGTGAVGGTLASVTASYSPATLVNLTGAATAPVVVSISVSDPSSVYAPATVTIPKGQTSASIGTLLATLWSPSGTNRSITITASYNGVIKTLTENFTSPFIHAFNCQTSCTVVGGQPQSFTLAAGGSGAPVGGATVTLTSSNTAVIPNQTATIAAGGQYPTPNPIVLTTNAVSSTTSVKVTASYNGSTYPQTITVNPGATPASIGVVSGSGQSATIGTAFTNQLVAVVETSSGAPVSGATVTFAGANVSFPSGATAVTGSNGQAQVTAEPTAAGALTITASVAGVSTPASFAETGTGAVGGTLASVTAKYGAPGTNVNLTGAATAPVVVSISVSDPSSVYVPATVTIPKGQTSVSIGSLLATLWSPYGTSRSITITASYNGVIKTLTENWTSPFIHSFGCQTSCTVVGGQPQGFTFAAGGSGAPVGGATVTFTSSNTAVIPNQTDTIPAGTQYPTPYPIALPTNAVTSTTTVKVTATYNGNATSQTITVNP